MGKITFLVGGAAGYVLGARAGRDRYEQISRLARRTKERPEVQRAAGTVTDTARATARGEGPVAEAAGSAAAKVSSAASSVTGRGGDDAPSAGPAQDVGAAPTTGSPATPGTSPVAAPPAGSGRAGSDQPGPGGKPGPLGVPAPVVAAPAPPPLSTAGDTTHPA